MTRLALMTKLLLVAICLGVPWRIPPAFSASSEGPVQQWTRLADNVGDGSANWHTLAIMHMAMHDALNAALPIFRRWAPPGPGEPSTPGGTPQAAMAAAARMVLLRLHPDHSTETERTFADAISRLAPGRERDVGVALGSAVGEEWVARRAQDGFTPPYLFPTSDEPGLWRPTPPSDRDSGTTKAVPFLSADRIEPGAPPPPMLGGARYVFEVDEVRRIGARDTASRNQAGTEAAMFWAFQESQRGYIDLGLRLLAQHPQPNGLWDDARVMSQLAAALADSAVIIWAEKEHFLRWRPITAIQGGGFGVVPDPAWEPLIETPHFPEYPSGHTSDCYTGAGVLAAVFGSDPGPITYRSLGEHVNRIAAINGMGQHRQGNDGRVDTRVFPDIPSTADECAQSRIWAGAHFRSANEESHRVAAAIVRRALAAVPPVR